VVHLNIEQEQLFNSIAFRYKLNGMIYHSLDEIIYDYINPVNNLIEAAQAHKKFLKLPLEAIEV